MFLHMNVINCRISLSGSQNKATSILVQIGDVKEAQRSIFTRAQKIQFGMKPGNSEVYVIA